MKSYLLKYKISGRIDSGFGGLVKGTTYQGWLTVDIPAEFVDSDKPEGSVVADLRGEITSVKKWGIPLTKFTKDLDLSFNDGDTTILFNSNSATPISGKMSKSSDRGHSTLIEFEGSSWNDLYMDIKVSKTKFGSFEAEARAVLSGKDVIIEVVEDDKDEEVPDNSFDFTPSDLKGRTLWKPVSESDGKLVFLFTNLLRKRINFVGIFKNGRLVERGIFKTDSHNGNRPHYRFRKSGGGYPDGCQVVAITKSGWKVVYTVGETSKRNDGNMTPVIIKPNA